jgi:hypothetical protein
MAGHAVLSKDLLTDRRISSGLCGLRCGQGCDRDTRHAPEKGNRKRSEQPVVKVRRCTEAGDAPGWQGATTENIGNS